MSTRMPARSLAVLALGAIVILGVAVARSAIPGPGGTIQGCYDNASGALRVIDPAGGGQCRPSSETAISFSQVGPAGLAGPAGPTGPQGPPGRGAEVGLGGPDTFERPAALQKPVRALSKTLRKRFAGLAPSAQAGGSKAYSVYNDAGGKIPDADDLGLTVLRLPLPAGRWVVIAKGVASVKDPVLFNGYPQCLVRIGPDSDEVTLFGRGFALTVVGRLAAPGAAELRCWTHANNEFFPSKQSGVESLRTLKMTGIPVAGLSNTPAPYGG